MGTRSTVKCCVDGDGIKCVIRGEDGQGSILSLCHPFISFHLFADNIAIYKAGTVISRLQVTTGQ